MFVYLSCVSVQVNISVHGPRLIPPERLMTLIRRYQDEDKETDDSIFTTVTNTTLIIRVPVKFVLIIRTIVSFVFVFFHFLSFI